MKIRDISQEEVVLEAPVGVMQRAKEKVKALVPGDVDAKRQNLVSSEINRVWKLVKQELSKELKNEYVPVNYFLEVMKQIGYLNSAREVVKAELDHLSPEDQRWENVKKAREENLAAIQRMKDKLAGLTTSDKTDSDEIEKDRERHASTFSDSKKYTKRPLRENEEQVLDKKQVQDLIKKTIELAAKKNPDEFARRAISKAKEKPTANFDTDNQEKAKGGDTNVSGGDIDPKPFKKAFQKAKSRVISKVPRKERDAVYDELQDIFRELYGEL